MGKEEWRPVKGYEHLYEVSSFGRVRSVERTLLCGGKYYKRFPGKIIRAWNNRGYKQIFLCDDYGRKHKSVHDLVAIAFIDNPDNKPCVDHIDGDRSNNNVSNLRWCTYKENSNFELVRKRISDAVRGEKHPMYGKFGADNYNSIPIVQCTKDGNVIREYAAAMDAFRETGISFSNIAAVCRGERKSAGGYIWKYKH